jgi:hypothetical protein
MTMNKPVTTLQDKVTGTSASLRRGLGALAIGAAALMGPAACSDSSPTGPVLDCKEGQHCPPKTDTLYVTKTDTLFIDKPDTLYFGVQPWHVQDFEVATLCPPSLRIPGQSWSRLEFVLRPRNSFYGSMDVQLRPAHFSQGCPVQMPDNIAESVNIGHLFNGLLVNPSDPTHPYHGQIVEVGYVTPVTDQGGSPGSVERGSPNEARFWKLQLARQEIPNPQGFTRAIRNGYDLVARDRVTGNEYSSASSAEHFIPITAPYLPGKRLALSENPAQWQRFGPYRSQTELDQNVLQRVIQSNRAVGR